MFTTAPTVTPSSRCSTAPPGEFIGSHTTPVGMSVTTSGSVIAPRAAVREGFGAVAGADRRGGGGREPGHRWPCGAGQVRLTVL